jgi:large subunit ribosomal protein L7/L12
MAKIKKEDIITCLKEMTIIEIHDLIKSIETEFGVSAAAPVAAAAATSAADAPTEVNIKLMDAGTNKVAIIKIVREINDGLGLMEAKKAVDGAPSVVKENVKVEEAEVIKKKFEDAGAKIIFE